jgi:uncharacterized glyoxalase superfamily protein PhnB
MPNPVKPIPERYHTLTPNLVCRNASAAIDFYKKVFGATELMRMPGPGGAVMHAELKFGDSIVFVNDTMSKIGLKWPAAGETSPQYLHLYVEDVDRTFQHALDSGATVDIPLQDMFWGDRYGKVTDPFGQQWGIATHKEDVSNEEMQRRMQAMSAKASA